MADGHDHKQGDERDDQPDHAGDEKIASTGAKQRGAARQQEQKTGRDEQGAVAQTDLPPEAEPLRRKAEHQQVGDSRAPAGHQQKSPQRAGNGRQQTNGRESEQAGQRPQLTCAMPKHQEKRRRRLFICLPVDAQPLPGEKADFLLMPGQQRECDRHQGDPPSQRFPHVTSSVQQKFPHPSA